MKAPALNIITEYIIGYIYPGYPVANMLFKVYGNVSMKQAIFFLQDFKLGHYMKIPPREMFLAQVCPPTRPPFKEKWFFLFIYFAFLLYDLSKSEDMFDSDIRSKITTEKLVWLFVGSYIIINWVLSQFYSSNSFEMKEKNELYSVYKMKFLQI